jgi:hypothetical protein
MVKQVQPGSKVVGGEMEGAEDRGKKWSKNVCTCE